MDRIWQLGFERGLLKSASLAGAAVGALTSHNLLNPFLEGVIRQIPGVAGTFRHGLGNILLDAAGAGAGALLGHYATTGKPNKLKNMLHVAPALAIANAAASSTLWNTETSLPTLSGTIRDHNFYFNPAQAIGANSALAIRQLLGN